MPGKIRWFPPANAPMSSCRERYLAAALICLAASSSCVHSRRAAAPKAPSANQALAREVTDQVARQYNAVSDFKATVLLSATLGQPGGKIRRYPPMRGFLLFRKPADMRIMGGPPLFGSRVFDLVSDGREFRLSVPPRKKFIIGEDDTETLLPNKLENIRPRHLRQVLLSEPPDPATETARLEKPDDSPGCTLLQIRHSRGVREQPDRTLWIDRATSRVTRELILDDTGTIVTDAHYSEWSQDDGVTFPRHIEIERPREEYRLVIRILAIEINHGLSDRMFVLAQPPGTVVEVLNTSDAPKRTDRGAR